MAAMTRCSFKNPDCLQWQHIYGLCNPIMDGNLVLKQRYISKKSKKSSLSLEDFMQNKEQPFNGNELSNRYFDGGVKF